MDADANRGFHQGHQGAVPSSMYNHVVSFQSGAVNSSSSMFSMAMDSPGGVSSTAGMIFAGSPGGISNTASMVHAGSSGNLNLDAQQGFKQDMGVPADWTYQEQSILEEGLVMYADEPNIMKYIKIAALLPDKTVRAVALRCRWMTKKENGKRRKSEDFFAGKKIKDRKDNLMDSPLKATMPPSQSANLGAYSFMMPHMDYNNHFSYEVPIMDSMTQHLLDENLGLFAQIEANLDTLKLQDNINLLHHTRNNITTILNSMREMPGIMSHMPPLPVALHDELVETILPSTSQQQVRYSMPGGNQLKQEPRC